MNINLICFELMIVFFTQNTLTFAVYLKITDFLNNKEIKFGFSRSWNRSFWAFLAGAEAGAAELELERNFFSI